TPEWHSPHAMKYFVSERRKSIANQLAGRSTGEHHAWNKGPGAEAVFKWLAFGVAFFVVSLINCAAWISGAIAGFRDSNRWGILNLLFYPLAPLVFGFGLRKARVAASFVVLSISMMIALVAVMFSLA
ncbi:MAG: hypothetical protein QF805_28750, partial [Pirellulaceae bacterium]|nr:hypothetical protein [Pirellulaceae bacterium]